MTTVLAAKLQELSIRLHPRTPKAIILPLAGFLPRAQMPVTSSDPTVLVRLQKIKNWAFHSTTVRNPQPKGETKRRRYRFGQLRQQLERRLLSLQTPSHEPLLRTLCAKPCKQFFVWDRSQHPRQMLKYRAGRPSM